MENARVKVGLSRILRLKLRDGTNVGFCRIRWVDATKIKILVGLLVPASAGEASGTQGFVSLCPTCLALLTPRVYSCPQCRTVFKDEKTLLHRALLIPGGAYLYVGFTGLGIASFIYEVFLLVLLIALLVEGFASGPTAAHRGSSPAGDATGTVIVLFALLAFDKTIAWAHSRSYVRDFIPTG